MCEFLIAHSAQSGLVITMQREQALRSTALKKQRNTSHADRELKSTPDARAQNIETLTRMPNQRIAFRIAGFWAA